MPLNDRLPFDVLAQLFEELAEIEDPTSPLELILEVCRFWRDSALAYRRLWMTFRMKITNRSEATYWKNCFPRRVNRFGLPDALLDISIVLVNSQTDERLLPYDTIDADRVRSVYSDAYIALGILRVVGGKHGTNAVRWRSLRLDFLRLGDLRDQDVDALDSFLHARTPNLESVELHGVITPFGYHGRIFPYSPRLRRAVFHSCEVSYYPDTSTLTSLTWYSRQDVSDYPLRNTPAIHALSSAQKVTYLEIGLDWTDRDTPLVFQHVETLKMPVAVSPGFAFTVQLPSLRHLAIGLDNEGHFSCLSDCKGIPLAQVETMETFYMPQGSPATEESVLNIVAGLVVLFADMVNLQVIEWNEGGVELNFTLNEVIKLCVGRKREE
jgi:hypothetical protein